MSPIAYLKSKLAIRAHYAFDGNIDEFMQGVNVYCSQGWNGVSARKVDDRVYEFVPNVSLGTLTGVARASIAVYLTVLGCESDRIRVVLWTNVRPENWFLLALFGFISATTFASSKPTQWLKGVLIAAAIFAACVLWFNFIYKMQEWEVVGKMEKGLQLVDAEPRIAERN